MNTDKHEFKAILAGDETLTVEFKTDLKGLSDRDLVAAVVAMANTEGGLILLGVEDNGTVTGVQPIHQDTAGLTALVTNRTNPSVAVNVEVVDCNEKNSSASRSQRSGASSRLPMDCCCGVGRGRTYTLSAKVYRRAGQKAGYVRQTGFDPIQQEQMVLSYIEKHGKIKRAEAAELCRISPFQATRLLKRLTQGGKIIPKGKGKGVVYEQNS